jgi:hypothetical protein
VGLLLRDDNQTFRARNTMAMSCTDTVIDTDTPTIYTLVLRLVTSLPSTADLRASTLP